MVSIKDLKSVGAPVVVGVYTVTSFALGGCSGTTQIPPVTLDTMKNEICGTAVAHIEPHKGLTVDTFFNQANWIRVANKYGISYSDAIKIFSEALNWYNKGKNGENAVDSYGNLREPWWQDGNLIFPYTYGSGWCPQSSSDKKWGKELEEMAQPVMPDRRDSYRPIGKNISNLI